MSDSLKLRSEAQREASRLNGAKSQGPRGQRDRRRHIVVLSNEDPDTYDKLTAAWTERLRPADDAESRLVAQIVNSDWCLNRLWQCETALLDEVIHNDVLPGTHSARMGRGMRTLADESTVLRYIKAQAAQLERTLNRALSTLQRLRSAFPERPKTENLQKPELAPPSCSEQSEIPVDNTQEKPDENPANPSPDALTMPSSKASSHVAESLTARTVSPCKEPASARSYEVLSE